MDNKKFREEWDNEEKEVESRKKQYMTGNDTTPDGYWRGEQMQTYDPSSNWGKYHGWGGRCKHCGMAHIIPPHGDHLILRIAEQSVWDTFWNGRKVIAICPVCKEEFIVEEPAWD